LHELLVVFRHTVTGAGSGLGRALVGTVRGVC